jgi:hypothetical protein
MRLIFADNFPKPWRLKRLLPGPKRPLGAAGAALLKALAGNNCPSNHRACGAVKKQGCSDAVGFRRRMWSLVQKFTETAMDCGNIGNI